MQNSNKEPPSNIANYLRPYVRDGDAPKWNLLLLALLMREFRAENTSLPDLLGLRFGRV